MIILVLAFTTKTSEYSSVQSKLGCSSNQGEFGRVSEKAIKDSKHPTVLMSDLFGQHKIETEFIDTDVTYKMFFSSKYRRTLLLGTTIAISQQLTGINAITTYTYYINIPGTRVNMNVYGFRFIMYLLRSVFSLVMVYILQVCGRKSLILAGYLIACFCNCILLQLSEDELGSGDEAYNTYVKVLAVIIVTIFYIS